MTDPKKAAPAPAPAANSPAAAPATTVRKTPTLAEIQELADRMRREDAASAPKMEKAAREAAQMEIEQLADKAIEWKKVRGVYPWEEPESERDTQIRQQQADWLRRAGIDPEKSRGEFRSKIEEVIRQREAQKKTDQDRSR